MRKKTRISKRFIKTMLVIMTVIVSIMTAQIISAQTIGEAVNELRQRINYARELLNDTHVSDTGVGIPIVEYWAARQDHDDLIAAIAAAQAVLDTPRQVQQSLNMTVLKGSHYAIPIAVEGVPLPIYFEFMFDPEKLVFFDMTENESVFPLSFHNPANGVLAFRYDGSSATNNLNRTGIINTPRFKAVASDDTTISITASWNDNEARSISSSFFASAVELSSDDDPENQINKFGNCVLTSTLGEAVGMQGFEGDYAIESPNEIVEIIVQFKTPPSASLRLMHEKGIFIEVALGHSIGKMYSFEEQALTAHDSFRQQLSQIFGTSDPSSGEYGIFSEHHLLFNGVFMRVPGNRIEQIAMLPEVFAVTPHIIVDDPETILVDETVESSSDNTFNTTSSPFFVNQQLMLETRQLLEIDYIHSNLGITGKGVRVVMLDGGIRSNPHPEFHRYLDNHSRVPGWQFYPTGTERAHGTQAAGALIAMAPEIELWAIQRLSADGPGLNVIEALEIAFGLEPDVIYLWGESNNHFNPISATVTPLVALHGIVVVEATHNWGPNPFSARNSGSLPINVGNGTAGGTGTQAPIDTIWSFSGRGPLGNTFHIKPDVIASGTDIRTTSASGGYITISGTSYSGPVVAGIAALLVQAFPNAEPWEIKSMIMNTARPLAGLNPNSVFTVGAGFVRPLEALTTQTIVTVEHEIPVGISQTAVFETSRMSSLSFGSVDPRGSAMPMQISNRGTISRTYTITHSFNNNPNNAASLSFSNTNVTVAAGGTVNINVTLNFGNNAPLGFYEGFIFVNTGGNVVARLPFAANLTETDNAAITTSTPNMSFNGTSYTLGTAFFSASNAFQGSRVLVVRNKYTAAGMISSTPVTRTINAGETIDIAPNTLVSTFLPGEQLEILVYRNVRQHLLTREIIRPVLFTF
ncbi:MAG: S8 family serine peptidase [Defluviitaleaceae bacterium]|nr:S8 family serine peptidase [Defluviitaleaceae bacterium]